MLVGHGYPRRKKWPVPHNSNFNHDSPWHSLKDFRKTLSSPTTNWLPRDQKSRHKKYAEVILSSRKDSSNLYLCKVCLVRRHGHEHLLNDQLPRTSVFWTSPGHSSLFHSALPFFIPYCLPSSVPKPTKVASVSVTVLAQT